MVPVTAMRKKKVKKQYASFPPPAPEGGRAPSSPRAPVKKQYVVLGGRLAPGTAAIDRRGPADIKDFHPKGEQCG